VEAERVPAEDWPHDHGLTERAEQLLRGLASGDETWLRSVLMLAPAPAPRARALPTATAALVHLAALLAVGASTTSLRWAVERALHAGAHDEQVVEVLATVAAAVGSARVVAAAPRLALAIGYDIQIEVCDGY
jgi:4-carboxymuconolactone decarboxylase